MSRLLFLSAFFSLAAIVFCHCLRLDPSRFKPFRVCLLLALQLRSCRRISRLYDLFISLCAFLCPYSGLNVQPLRLLSLVFAYALISSFSLLIFAHSRSASAHSCFERSLSTFINNLVLLRRFQWLLTTFMRILSSGHVLFPINNTWHIKWVRVPTCVCCERDGRWSSIGILRFLLIISLLCSRFYYRRF